MAQCSKPAAKQAKSKRGGSKPRLPQVTLFHLRSWFQLLTLSEGPGNTPAGSCPSSPGRRTTRHNKEQAVPAMPGNSQGSQSGQRDPSGLHKAEQQVASPWPKTSSRVSFACHPAPCAIEESLSAATLRIGGHASAKPPRVVNTMKGCLHEHMPRQAPARSAYAACCRALLLSLRKAKYDYANLPTQELFEQPAQTAYEIANRFPHQNCLRIAVA